jgi:hypothetical protein
VRLVATKEHDKQIRLTVLKEQRGKQLKNKIDEKLKNLKKLQDARASKKNLQLDLQKKEALLKKKAADRIRQVQREQKLKLKEQLKQKKLANWVRLQKEKEKDYITQLKAKASGKLSKKKKTGPPRAKNAFAWYLHENYHKVAETLGSKSAAAVMKAASQKFQSLGESEKKHFLDLAGQDKERYTTEKKRFVAHKKSKQKPLTPYFRYMRESFPSVKKELGSDKKVTDVVKQIAEQWKKLDPSAKEKYVAEYKKEAAQHASTKSSGSSSSGSSSD